MGLVWLVLNTIVRLEIVPGRIAMSDKYSDTSSSIEKLTGLYQKDPELFEEERKKLIQDTIDSFPPEYRSRAEGLQFKIDLTLAKYKDPVARMNKMVEIFWGHFLEFQEVMNNPAGFLKKNEEKNGPGKVLQFHR